MIFFCFQDKSNATGAIEPDTMQEIAKTKTMVKEIVTTKYKVGAWVVGWFTPVILEKTIFVLKVQAPFQIVRPKLNIDVLNFQIFVLNRTLRSNTIYIRS